MAGRNMDRLVFLLVAIVVVGGVLYSEKVTLLYEGQSQSQSSGASQKSLDALEKRVTALEAALSGNAVAAKSGGTVASSLTSSSVGADGSAAASTGTDSRRNGFDGDFLQYRGAQAVGPEVMWRELAVEAGALKRNGTDPGVFFEVGVFNMVQCSIPPKSGIESHCIEPSPNNYKRVMGGYRGQKPEHQELIHVYNVAAGASSEGTVPFTRGGSTGDHVGDLDMWMMNNTVDDNLVTMVPIKKMDDLVNEVGKPVFVMKIDTQGYEASVLAGLKESLRNHKIQYILSEYWPTAIDSFTDKGMGSCEAAKYLSELQGYGYKLYALLPSAHPKAPRAWTEMIPEMPLNNFDAYCRWFYKVDEKHPSEEYNMGYWSDILAVAPNAKRMKLPKVSRVGRLLSEK